MAAIRFPATRIRRRPTITQGAHTHHLTAPKPIRSIDTFTMTVSNPQTLHKCRFPTPAGLAPQQAHLRTAASAVSGLPRKKKQALCHSSENAGNRNHMSWKSEDCVLFAKTAHTEMKRSVDLSPAGTERPCRACTVKPARTPGGKIPPGGARRGGVEALRNRNAHRGIFWPPRRPGGQQARPLVPRQSIAHSPPLLPQLTAVLSLAGEQGRRGLRRRFHPGAARQPRRRRSAARQLP